jgi:hypothetical protein
VYCETLSGLILWASRIDEVIDKEFADQSLTSRRFCYLGRQGITVETIRFITNKSNKSGDGPTPFFVRSLRMIGRSVAATHHRDTAPWSAKATVLPGGGGIG